MTTDFKIAGSLIRGWDDAIRAALILGLSAAGTQSVSEGLESLDEDHTLPDEDRRFLLWSVRPITDGLDARRFCADLIEAAERLAAGWDILGIGSAAEQEAGG